MFGKRVFKKLVSLFLAFSFVLTPLTSFASENEGGALANLAIYKDILREYEENGLEDVELPVIDFALMTDEEKAFFYEAVEYEVARVEEETARSRSFDGTFDSETYKEQLVTYMTTGELPAGNSVSRAFGIGIPNSIVASAINVTISIVVGGTGLAAIQTYIRQAGVDAARKIFTKTVITELTKIGAPYVAVTVGIIVEFILDLINIGDNIASYLDSIDDKPNNGYVDF